MTDKFSVISLVESIETPEIKIFKIHGLYKDLEKAKEAEKKLSDSEQNKYDTYVIKLNTRTMLKSNNIKDTNVEFSNPEIEEKIKNDTHRRATLAHHYISYGDHVPLPSESLNEQEQNKLTTRQYKVDKALSLTKQKATKSQLQKKYINIPTSKIIDICNKQTIDSIDNPEDNDNEHDQNEISINKYDNESNLQIIPDEDIILLAREIKSRFA